MSEKPTTAKWKRRLTRLGWITLALLIFGGVAFLLRAPILTTAANAWIVHEPEFEWVDAIIIPGGGIDTRPFTAAELFHEGKTDKTVTFKTEPLPATLIGVTPEHHELNIDVLKRLEVPDSAITLIGDGVTSTWDEVKACYQWCLENEIRSIAVVTELFPSKRVKWAYEKMFESSDTNVFVYAIAPAKYQANNWWQEETGIVAFQNEVIKYVYYQLKY